MYSGEREAGRGTRLSRFNRNKTISLESSITLYFDQLKPKEGLPAFSGNSRALRSASTCPLPVTADGATRRDKE